MHDAPLDELIEAAYRQTLMRFDKTVQDGERNPRDEIDVYRRYRRDYLSLLRLDQPSDEARDLAARLLETRGTRLDPERREAFEKDVTRMLVRLYDAFIARAE